MTERRAPVAEFYDDAARQWDATHLERQNPVFRKRLHRSLAALLEPARGGALAIELGAGTGPYLELVAPLFRRLVCTDVSTGMLEVLETRRRQLGLGNVEARCEDAAALTGFADSSADAIYSVGMFETIAEPARVFATARRVLRQGGTFAGITSNGSCPWYPLRRRLEGGERAGQIVHFMTAGEMRRLAAATRFEVSTVDCWGLVPPGLSGALAARILDAIGSALHATPLARFLGVLAFRLTAR
jgi:ubiquinone/menaquinone biosynthesis C-methylase UbiE